MFALWIFTQDTFQRCSLRDEVKPFPTKGPFKCLCNAVGGGRVSDYPEKCVTKMYGSTLLELRGGGWVSNFQKKTLGLRNT